MNAKLETERSRDVATRSLETIRTLEQERSDYETMIEKARLELDVGSCANISWRRFPFSQTNKPSQQSDKQSQQSDEQLGSGCSLIAERSTSWGEFLLPDDFTVRLGFAGGSKTPSGAAALAGAGNFYIEGGVGWNVLRFTWPTDVDRTPMRGALNFEYFTSWSNDPDLLDIHQRDLIGLALAFGFPMSTDEAALPVPIGELLVRFGAAHVEIPEFKSGSGLVNNEVVVDHGVPDFKSKWGFGLDAEFNLPVARTGTYLTLRGLMNRNYDPNPWAAMVGYTIPLSAFSNILVGGEGSK